MKISYGIVSGRDTRKTPGLGVRKCEQNGVGESGATATAATSISRWSSSLVYTTE